MKDWYERYISEDKKEHSDDDDAWTVFKKSTQPLKKPIRCHEGVVDKPLRTVIQKVVVFERPIEGSVDYTPQFSAVTPKKRRKMVPKKTIDLHGMTKDQAFENLIKFIEFSYQNHEKIILVITGKGRLLQGQEKTTTLRESLPLWLQTFPLKQWVIGMTTARPEHGGSGSFYILLKSKAK